MEGTDRTDLTDQTDDRSDRSNPSDQSRVIDVVAGSSAAEAGIKIGDRLTTMDGQPLGELPLERVRRRLRGRAGDKVELTFERGGEVIRLALPLRRVV